MLVFPHAKINIGLNVVSRRTDGYHDLETVFYPLSLCDILEIIPSDSFSFCATGIPVDQESETNLVVKAYELLKKEFSLPPVAIHLHKMIPPGAGLGGGSSDASHALLVLNQLFALHLSDDALRDRALQLGSDCPYFLYNRPLFAEGRGELFSEVRVNLRNYRIVLVKPPCSVSTSLAYQNIKPVPAKYLLRQEIGQDPVRWGEKISNDFETQVFPAFPEIRLIKERMIEQGAVYASMSGSGSAVFGIFPETAGSFREEFPGLFYWEEAGKDF